MNPEKQGVTLDRYMLIPRTLIFLTRDDHILLLKGAPHKRLWANLYNGYGGHVERGEDIITAAKRELREEAGLEGNELHLCGVVTIDTGPKPGICMFVLHGTCQSGEPQPSEEGEPAWLPLNALDQYPVLDDLTTLIPRVLAVRPGDPPFAAQYRFDEDGNLLIEFSE